MTSQPIVPVELQELVIDCVAEQDINISSKNTRQALRNCALVCRNWHIHARRWILSRVELTILFSDPLSQRSEDPPTSGYANHRAESFLRCIQNNPAILNYIESFSLNLVRDKDGQPSPDADVQSMALTERLCATLKPTIREVSLASSDAHFIGDSVALQRLLEGLYNGPKIHAIYALDMFVPSSLVARASTIGKLVLDECPGLLDVDVLPLDESPEANSSPSTLVIENSRRTTIFSDLCELIQQNQSLHTFFVDISNLSVCISHSIPEAGIWDLEIYGDNLTTLNLTYKDVTAGANISQALVERFANFPWSSLRKLVRLGFSIELFKSVISNKTVFPVHFYPFTNANFDMLYNVSKLPALRDLIVDFAFPNICFERVDAIQDALEHTFTDVVDSQFDIDEGFERLRVIHLSLDLMVAPDNGAIKKVAELGEILEDSLPNLLGQGGCADMGLGVILRPTLRIAPKPKL